MPESLFHLELALLGFNRYTPFAYLAVLGAALAVLGAAIVFLAGEAIGFERNTGKTDLEKLDNELLDMPREDPKPGEKGFMTWITTIKVFENGYYVFLAGMILFAIGLYPFVAAYAP